MYSLNLHPLCLVICILSSVFAQSSSCRRKYEDAYCLCLHDHGCVLQAGQVLKSERDQLAQLMAHLRQDYEAVERAKVAQQEELAALKERMKKKGAANNKMLVKVCGEPRFRKQLLTDFFAHVALRDIVTSFMGLNTECHVPYGLMEESGGHQRRSCSALKNVLRIFFPHVPRTNSVRESMLMSFFTLKSAREGQLLF